MSITHTNRLVKRLIRIDDSMDIFAEHGVAGILGLLANAPFGATYIIGLDGVNTGVITGGWINHKYKQLYIQTAYILAASGWAFTISLLIAAAINMVPGLHLRASSDAELQGMDDDQLGEFAYDYVEVRRDYLAWTPSRSDALGEDQNIPMHQRHGINEHTDLLAGQVAGGEGDRDRHERTGIKGDRHGIEAEKKMH